MGTMQIVILFSLFFLGLLGYGLSYIYRSRRKTEVMLRQLDNYNSIIDQANDAMLVIDIVDGRIHQANPSAATLLGCSEFELSQMTFFDIHPKEYYQRSSEIVADVWEKGGLIYKDVPFKTRSGEVIPVECSARVAPFAGRPAIVIYARDIRERLRLEAEIDQARRIIDVKNKDIRDSIEYSRRIQESVFLEKDRLKDLLSESFIFFRPREVVSGDFYWFSELQVHKGDPAEAVYPVGTRMVVIAAVDCTGHGVPGAFVSLIGNALLSRAMSDKEIYTPAKAMDHMNLEIKASLNKNKNLASMRDGMDMALVFIDPVRRQLQYAGANNPVCIIRHNNGRPVMEEFKADKQSITPSHDVEVKPFANRVVNLEPGDVVYLFTDGYADQFGGAAIHGKPEGRKFMARRLRELLLSIAHLPAEEQQKELERNLDEWQGDLPQVDDILVIGIKIG